MMTEVSIKNAMETANHALRLGDFETADKIYTKILTMIPEHSDANHNLGVLAVSVGKAKEALRYFKKAIKSDLANLVYWKSYLTTLSELKLHDVVRTECLFSDQIFENDFEYHSWKTSNFIGFKDDERKLIDSFYRELNKNSFSRSREILKLVDSIEHGDVFHYLSGLVDLKEQSYTSAIKQFIKSITINKNFPSAYLQLITIYMLRKNFMKAIEISESMQTNWPNSDAVHFQLALSYEKGGLRKKAIDAYKHVILLNSDHARALNNLGLLLYSEGMLHEAITYLTQAIECNPNEAFANYNLAQVYTKLQSRENAIKCLQREIEINSSFIGSHIDLGVLLLKSSSHTLAIRSFEKALELDEDNVKALNGLGAAYKNISNFEQSVDILKKSIAVKPDYKPAYYNLAETYEKFNQLETLKEFIQETKQILTPFPDVLKFYEAMIFFRERDYEDALDTLKKVDVTNFPKERLSNYLQLKGKILEKQKHFSEAFLSFDKMNSSVRQTTEFRQFRNTGYIERVKGILNSKAFAYEENSIISEKSKTRTFIVGFPRSGTTLLDTILRSHSAIQLVEEKPMLITATAKFVEAFHLGREGWNDETCLSAIAQYDQHIKEYTDNDPNSKVIIDKLPLNLVQLPLINYLFPNAKIIMCLRHPCDAILSNWKQNYKLNSAMAMMTSLDDITNLYNSVMGIYEKSVNSLNMNIHVVRYEDIVENFKSEVEEIVRFLDLQWEDGVMEYQKTAFKRGKINTPSYTQVIQPIYKDSKFAWENYRTNFEDVVVNLQHWIHKFGY